VPAKLDASRDSIFTPAFSFIAPKVGRLFERDEHARESIEAVTRYKTKRREFGKASSTCDGSKYFDYDLTEEKVARQSRATRGRLRVRR
jgi:hypothetical protein